ncbi:hypothetical protein H5410_004078 [Solanum commersonii]|uniref:Uncharacterized protein n=1 Tax=Solanum commersonii TaxID=4109 RepID=A0A9J6B6R0_SOLCO|nr:hypothetical protein H5410_004078 [Solanum commersonii]
MRALRGSYKYRKTCRVVLTSSQGLTGHRHNKMSQVTWTRGVPHQKFVCPFVGLLALYYQLGKHKSTSSSVTWPRTHYHPC